MTGLLAVFNNRIYHQASDAQVFTQHNFVQENVTIDLLKTPEDPEWTFETICDDASTMAPEDIMRKYYDLLEEEIRETPHNWLWSHNRWKW